LNFSFHLRVVVRNNTNFITNKIFLSVVENAIHVSQFNQKYLQRKAVKKKHSFNKRFFSK